LLTATITATNNWESVLQDKIKMALFNDRYLKSLKPKKNDFYDVEKSGVRGGGRFVLRVRKNGKKEFYVQYFIEGKRKFQLIGPYAETASLPGLTLKEARQHFNKHSEQLQQGVNLQQKREADKVAEQALSDEILRLEKEEELKGSLNQLINAYTDNMQKEGKRTFKQVKNAVATDVYPVINEVTKAKDVTSEQIKYVLAKMIQRGAATHSNRIRSYLHAAFNYGIKHDNDPAHLDRGTMFFISHNPVTVVPRQASAERVRERELSRNEITILFKSIEQNGFDEVTRILIKLLFFTGGQRPYELMATQWTHIDFERKLWEMPSTVAKNKKAHLVPLTDTALSLLTQLKLYSGNSIYLFPKHGNNDEFRPTTSLAQAVRRFCERYNLAMEEQDNAEAKIEKFQPKDIRRTCKTRMGELGITKEIRDKIHNHAQNDVSAKHYDRYDYVKEKKEALLTWEKWLNSLSI